MKVWTMIIVALCGGVGMGLAQVILDGAEDSALILDGDPTSSKDPFTEEDLPTPSEGGDDGDEESTTNDVADSDECAAFTCFAQDECPYQADGGGQKPWQEVGEETFSHRVTGIPKPPKDGGGLFMATYVLAGEEAKMTSPTSKLTADRTFRLSYYEAVEGHTLEVCCSEDCDPPNFASSTGVSASHYNQWQEAEFTCPEGTSQISIRCRSVEGSKHRGACGVSKLDILDEDGESICGEEGYEDEY